MKVAYLAHDVGDPAIVKRVAMLQAAGAAVVVLGFRRTAEPVATVHGAPVHDLGRTYDSRLADRAMAVLGHIVRTTCLRPWLHGVNVILARNLEMLAIAARLRPLAAPAARLVYECLDIHPAMVGAGPRSHALRAMERGLLRRCQLLIVSSPAFVTAYFTPYQALATPVLVVENKALSLLPRLPVLPPPPRLAAPPPWRVGWFGVLRAQKALDILGQVATAHPGLVEVVLRGRPALVDFTDFHGQVARTPGLSFGGAYAPDDLVDMYAGIDLCWAFDYFDEHANSAWLLPNRLYEGGQFAAVPLARAGTQTGRWLQQHGIGAVFTDPATELGPWLQALTPDRFAAMQAAARALPRNAVVAGPDDCRALLDALAGPP